MTSHLSALRRCVANRSENPIIEYYSPMRSVRGRWLMRILLGFFPLYSAWHLLDPSNFDPRLWDYGRAAILILYLLPLVLCALYFRRFRDRHVAQDLWLSATPPGEIVFGLCYWPVVVHLLATASAVLAAPLHVIIYEELGRFVEFSARAITPLVGMLILLRHSLSEGEQPLFTAARITVDCVATFVGVSILRQSVGFLLEIVPLSRAVIDLRMVIGEGLVLSAVLFGKGSLLLSQGVPRFFATVESFPTPTPPEPTPRLPLARATVLTFMTTSSIWLLIIVAVSVFWVGPTMVSDHGVLSKLLESGVLFFPVGMSMAAFGVLCGMASLARSTPHGDLGVAARFPTLSSARIVAPIVLAAMLPMVGAMIMSLLAMGQSRDSEYWLLGLIIAAVAGATCLATLLAFAMMLVPRTGRRIRLILGTASAISGIALILKIYSGPRSNEGFFFRPIDAPAFALSVMFVLLGWVVACGYQNFRERLYRDGVP